jgi:hypothetical protein
MFVVDEIADFLAPSASAEGQQGGQRSIGGPTAFINFLKTTMSGTSSGPYKYKFFGLFAAENLDNFIHQGYGPSGFYNNQIQQRLGQIMKFEEMGWEPIENVQKWLKNAIDYLGKESGYSTPSLASFSASIQEKEKENLNKFYRYVVQKAKSIFYNPGLDEDDINQPSVQRSLGTTIDKIIENYQKYRKGDETWQEFLALRSEIYLLRTHKLQIEEDIADLEAQLGATPPTEASLVNIRTADTLGARDDEPTEKPVSKKPATPAATPTDDVSGYFGDISTREEGVGGEEQRRQLQEANPTQEQLAQNKEDLVSIERDLQIKEKKIKLIIGTIRHDLMESKVDDKIGSVDGDFIAENLSDFEFFKITDLVNTPGDQILVLAKTQEEERREARRSKIVKDPAKIFGKDPQAVTK